MNSEHVSNFGKSGLTKVLVVLAAVFIVLFLIGVVPRIFGLFELKQAHEETVGAVPVVHTVVARPAPNTESLTLPGNIGAILYTSIYARVDGYLKQRFVDIGDKVKTGQLLAIIDTPTVDEKLAMSRADLKKAQANLLTAQSQLKEAIAQDLAAKNDIVKAQANLDYATVTAKRWVDLAERGAVSLQSRDEKVRFMDTQTSQVQIAIADEEATAAKVKAAESNVKAAQASVAANVADVRRLEAEQGFQKVVAPFDGVITLRKVDPGALITQGSGSSNLELFQMANIDRLRIYVSVPQRAARYIHDGMKADIRVPEFPERNFIGTVTNVSGALDPNTRTRQTEIQINNPDHALLPGMYTEIVLNQLREQPWIRVPGTTIVTRADGQFVVVIKDSKAHYQPITMGRDFGDQVEIKVGLKGNETVVVSPSDDLREGEQVQVVPAPNAT